MLSAPKCKQKPSATNIHSLRKGGLEPPRPKSLDPKSSASTNSATLAFEASTAISNNALTLLAITDAKSERIRLPCYDCQGNSGSPAGPPMRFNCTWDYGEGDWQEPAGIPSRRIIKSVRVVRKGEVVPQVSPRGIAPLHLVVLMR
jgi:hypothetical protein